MDTRRGRIPGWQERIDAGGSQSAPHLRHAMGTRRYLDMALFDEPREDAS